ncbi:MAG: PAS domain-containing protein [Planctomycetes bacterium]|nr:PAS domain-containing protein [Planctomycetota bacterium]
MSLNPPTYHPGLRVRLLLLVLLAVLPALAVIVYSGIEHRTLAVHHAQIEALRVAHVAGQEHSRAFDDARNLLRSLSQIPSIRRRDWTETTGILENVLRENPLYANLGVILPNGTLVCSAHIAPSRLDLADRAYLQRALQTRRFAMGDYQIGRATGRPTVNVAYPLLDKKGEVDVVLFAALDLKAPKEHLVSTHFDTEAVVWIIDSKGTLLFRDPPEPKWIGNSLADRPFIQTVLREHEGTTQAEGRDGQPAIFAFLPLIPDTSTQRAYLVVENSTASAFADVRRTLVRNLAVLLGTTLLALVIAWFAGNAFVLRRINTLAATAARMSAGNLDAHIGPDYGPAEIGELERAFDSMAAALARRDQEVREAEAKYRSLVEESPVVMYIADPTGPARYVSPQFEVFTGYPAAQWTTEPDFWHRIIHPDDRDRVVAEYRRCVEENQRLVSEYRLVCRDDKTRWFRDTGIPVAKDGRHLIRGFLVDITDRKRVEEQFHQAQKMEAIGRLAGSVAHDFNNLLTVIGGYTQLLLARFAPSDPLTAPLQEVHQAAQRAASLTRRLLAFSRKQAVRTVILDLNVVLEQMKNMLQRLMGEQIQLSLRCAPQISPILADPGQIEQVVMNLTVNARDAMPGGGMLSIETRNMELDETYARENVGVRPGSYVLLSVTDNGTGMNADTKAHLFEPFFTTKEPGKGTGLGLSTVYGIVQHAGGHINVYSELGKGTAFKIYFPRSAETAPSAASPAEPPPAGGSETILLAEDDAQLRTFVHSTLTNHGYKVFEAPDGQQALQASQAYQDRIHLLLTDTIMPRMDGIALAKAVIAQRPGIRILCMSGYTEECARHQPQLPEGSGFMAKPFTSDQLVRRVRQMLDGRPAES